MGVAYKNLAMMKSDFSQMPPTRSGFDCERISADRIDWIFDYERNRCYFRQDKFPVKKRADILMFCVRHHSH